MAQTRRDILKHFSLGAGATMFAPFLRSVQAQADGTPETPRPRFVFILKASGIDRHNLLPRGHNANTQNGQTRTNLVNMALNRQNLPEMFAPLQAFSDKVTILQGLSGANFNGNHTAGYGTLSCHNSERVPVAPTLDYLLGSRFSTGPYPMYGMAMNGALLGQATPPENGYCYPNLSAMGPGRAIAYQASPAKTYRELFGSAIMTPREAEARITIRTNLMDFLREDARRVSSQLNSESSELFDNYTNAIESLRVRDQRRVALAENILANAPEYTDIYTSRVETDRQTAHFELATAALISGLTNVVTIRPDTLGTIYTGLGINGTGLHQIGHGAQTDNGWTSERARREIDRHHLGLIAAMARRLQAVPEGNRTMLDNTLIVYTSCAGGSHHGGQRDWPFILVGGLGNRLRTGRYIQFPTHRQQGHKTIANLYLTILEAARVPHGETFGQADPTLRDFDLNGPLSELLL